MKDRCKRLVILMIAFIATCLYVDSHVQHDIWMTQRIAEQQDQIDYLLDYIKKLKEGE
jgi:hypothetical protein